MRKLFVLLCILMTANYVYAQQPTFDVPPTEKKGFSPRKFYGYYQSGVNRIVINENLKKGIAHYLYDTSFNLISKFERSYTEAEIYYNVDPLRFSRQIADGDDLWEAFVCDTAVAIRQLDFKAATDNIIAVANFDKGYKNAHLLAVMPQQHGCDFLVLAGKKKEKKLMIYRWLKDSQLFSITEFLLPQSTLSEAELKQYTKALEVNFSTSLFQITSSRIDQPDIFQLPSQTQLFYSDTAFYILSPTPISTGINVLALNLSKKEIRSTNYFVNEANANALGTSEQKHITATAYDSTLIIQSGSEKIFQYYFFNVRSGSLIRSYSVPVKDSLNILVHSSLNQLGTFGSKLQEKDIANEKAFMRKKNNGYPFMMPSVSGDSLVLSFGSLIRTTGIEGLLLAAATAAISYSAFIVVDNIQYIPFLISHRHKLIYAHSKFNVSNWAPSTATNTTTYMDQIIDNDKVMDAAKNSSILIYLNNCFYLAVYNNNIKKYQVNIY